MEKELAQSNIPVKRKIQKYHISGKLYFWMVFWIFLFTGMLDWANYELENPDQVDYLQITDGDGSLLGYFGATHYVENGEGGRRKGIKISNLTSVTETVHVLFHTDQSVTRSGWRLEWSKSD